MPVLCTAWIVHHRPEHKAYLSVYDCKMKIGNIALYEKGVGMEFLTKRSNWLEDVRAHLAMASVSNSALMKQSGKGRVLRSQTFLLNEMPLSGLRTMCENEFAAFLDAKTEILSKQLPRIEDSHPNWGAARKVINIFLRLCAMNKDLNPAYGIGNLEPVLEVPLDNHIVSKIIATRPTPLVDSFQIKTLTPSLSAAIQADAKEIAEQQGLFRYELDVRYWNNVKISRKMQPISAAARVQ